MRLHFGSSDYVHVVDVSDTHIRTVVLTANAQKNILQSAVIRIPRTESALHDKKIIEILQVVLADTVKDSQYPLHLGFIFIRPPVARCYMTESKKEYDTDHIITRADIIDLEKSRASIPSSEKKISTHTHEYIANGYKTDNPLEKVVRTLQVMQCEFTLSTELHTRIEQICTKNSHTSAHPSLPSLMRILANDLGATKYSYIAVGEYSLTCVYVDSNKPAQVFTVTFGSSIIFTKIAEICKVEPDEVVAQLELAIKNTLEEGRLTKLHAAIDSLQDIFDSALKDSKVNKLAFTIFIDSHPALVYCLTRIINADSLRGTRSTHVISDFSSYSFTAEMYARMLQSTLHT